MNVIPACLGPRPLTDPPCTPLPVGSWDTHFHVLGPSARFPYAEGRRYTPPDAPLDAYLAVMEGLGIARGIVVQPNLHGLDNAVTLDALDQGEGRFYGVVKLAPDVPAATLRDMHARGVRGVRFAFNPAHGGTLDLAAFEAVTHRIAPFGWFVEIHPAEEHLEHLAEWIHGAPVPVVIDHFGRCSAAAGPDAAPFRTLCDLAREPHVWVKITGAERISAAGPPWADVVPLARRLATQALDRLLWGTDWPHTGMFDEGTVPDDAGLVDLLSDFLPDPAERRTVLVDNPVRLLAGA